MMVEANIGVVRRIDLRSLKYGQARELLRGEWLATNGLGGYASGTISGAVTWRYHGLLVAALPAPFGRMVMLNHLSERLRFNDGRVVQIGGDEAAESGDNEAEAVHVTEFRLENGLPIWRFEVEGLVVEKHVLFLHGQNTVHINYHLVSDKGSVELELTPSVCFRGHDQPVDAGSEYPYRLTLSGERFEVSAGDALPVLRMVVRDGNSLFLYGHGARREIPYSKDAERGYSSRGSLWTPGTFRVSLEPRHDATLMASTEEWHRMLALSPSESVRFYHDRHRRMISLAPKELHDSPGADLVLAADQFIITPAGRLQDAARAHAAGDEIRTVIAGYHWFTDWGRDTMISLEGLTLTTNRHHEAGWILRTFAHYIRDGLVPNLFPEGQNQGLYHTADATLWFFHALDRYLEYTGDRDTLRMILPKLIDVAEHHLRGTHFGIRVDPKDGLLMQGAPGYQLTWMDAKVEDWVVTPRRGKAVEINGLWHNALSLLAQWLAQEQGEAAAEPYLHYARRVGEAFNKRFWNESGGYLYDIVDGEEGNDPACRPNQLLSFSLIYPVLHEARWKPVLEVVRQRLLTPFGLRSLSPDHPEFKPKCFGDLRARDAAYHQGTVWAWLIGPFVDAWLKVYPEDRSGARRCLEGFLSHLDQACIGSVSEIFDAEEPYAPRGCIAQAWSVAELLRVWLKTAETGAKVEARRRAKRPLWAI